MKARRWRRFALATSVVLGMVGAAGCSLGFHPSDYEGSDEDDDAPPAHDAAPTDATTGDAADAASSSDATVDSGTDASDGSFLDGATGTFCSTVDAAFCADFDDGSVQAGWDGVDTVSAREGTLALDTTYAVSLPASEHATLRALEPDAEPGNLSEYLEKTIATTTREVVLDFDFTAAQLVGSRLTFITLLYEGNEELGVELGLDSTRPNAVEVVALTNDSGSGTGWGYSSFDDFADGGINWHHIHVDLVVAPDGAGRVDVYVDGSQVVPLSPLSFDTDPEAKSLQLQVGIVRGGSVTPAMDVHFDNVVVTFP